MLILLSSFLLVLTSVACAGGSSSRPSGGSWRFEAMVEVRSRGVVHIDWQGEIPIAVEEGQIDPTRSGPAELFSLGGLPLTSVSDELGFRFALQLVRQYEGDGIYTIGPNTTPDGQRTLTASDAVLEVTYPTQPENPLRRFDRVVAECRLELRDEAKRGELRCPRVLDLEGGAISLGVAWTET